MEALYESQKELVNTLSNLIRNYKADGKERKSDPAYYGKKLTKLDEWWAEFDGNDSKLRQLSEFNEAHEYVIEDTYDRTKIIYEKQRETILNDEEILKKKILEKRLVKQQMWQKNNQME